MGKKLDALLGRRTFKAYKFKAVANLAISRIAVFKNQRQVRCNQARSDVVQLLEQGHQDRALLRVEHVIKEQNMLDVYVMIEGYSNLLLDRLHLIEQERVCPDEMKEAIASLLYASSRCGDFPELQEIRAAFTSRYGKEFVASAIELRNHCGVNPKMIQKLSTRQPDSESRMKVLKEIASENNITLQFQEGSSATAEGKLDVNRKQNQDKPETLTSSSGTNVAGDMRIWPEEREKDRLSDSMQARKKYRDVADAAQAAFESAANAAAAARSAVELSRSGPHDPDDQSSNDNHRRKTTHKDKAMKLESDLKNQEIQHKNEAAEVNATSIEEQNRLVSASSSEAEDNLEVGAMLLDTEDLVKQLDKDIVFDESDNESHDSRFNSELKGEILRTENSSKHIPSIIESGLRQGYSTAHAPDRSGIQSSKHLNIEKGPVSVRARRVRGF